MRRLSNVQKIWQLRSFLRENQVDILELYFPDSTLFGALAGRLAGVPCTIETAFNLGYWITPGYRFVMRRIGFAFHASIANSEAVKQGLVQNFGRRSESVTVLENGIDLARFADCHAYEAADFRHETPRIGMVANLRTVKAPEVLIHAAAIVQEQYPDSQFIIAGEGFMRDELQRLIHEKNLAETVHLPGAVEKIPQFLERLNVAVICSRSEGASNALIEYMAAGRPIVATNVGGNPEMISHEQQGLLVPADDPRELAASILRLLNNQTLSCQLARAARRRAEERYSLSAMVNRFADFYQSFQLTDHNMSSKRPS